MAAVTRIWMGPLAAAVLFLGAGRAVSAQSGQPQSPPGQSLPAGSLAGKLTDLRSLPLAGVVVILRNVATGVEVHATTAKNGAYLFPSLAAGEYTMEADSPQLGQGRLVGIEVFAGQEARVQAAMQFEPPAPSPLAPATLQTASHSAAPPTPPKMVPQSPQMTATLPLVPLRAPQLPTRPMPGLAGTPHAAVSPALAATVAPEPFQQSPVTGPKIKAPASKTVANKTVASTAPVLESSQPSVPAQLSERVAQPSQRTPQTPPLAATRPAPPAAARQLAVLKPEAAIEPAMKPVLEPALAGPVQRALRPASAGALSLAMSIAAAQALRAAIALSSPHLSPVQAAAEEVDPATSAVTTTITAGQLQALPVSGRRWQDFVLDTPASAAPADSSQVALRGSGEDPADTTIDGASARLAFGVAAVSSSRSPDSGTPGTGAEAGGGMGQAWNGGRGFAISESAIREVQMVAGNVEAEGAHAAGGRTNVETESGGNQLHGQGFLFDRQNTWGARNPFTQWVQNTGTAAVPVFTSEPYTPPDHETTWGIGVGSRIVRNKLFWFAALDAYRRSDPGLAMTRDPTTNSSVFFYLPEPTSPQIQLLSAQLGESQNQAYNDYLGVPTAGYTAAGLEQLDNLLGPAPRTAAQWVGFVRIDWQAAERHHFTIEGIGADWNSPGGGLTRVSANYGNHSFGSSEAGQQWLLARWEAFLTPNLLTVTQGSAGREILTARPDAPSAFEQGLLSGNAWGQLPQIVVDSGYGFTIGNPSRFGQGSYPDERLYHGQEMVDWVNNTLLLKAGVEIGHNTDATSLLRNQTGTYTYANVEDFIADALAFEKFGTADALDPRNPHNCGATDTTFGSQPCYSYFSQTIGPNHWHLGTNDWAGYVTAQWQSGKLAVFSAGLRWEREQLPPPIPALANSVLLSPGNLLTQKLPDLGNQWGPRVSLAIGSSEGHWPLLRLGYGMYYGRTENATVETALTQTGSFNGDLRYFMRATDDCQHCAGGAPPFPSVLNGPPGSVVTPGAVEFAPNFRNPEVHQAVAALEEALPGRVQLTASAVVSLGRRLPVFLDANLNPPAQAQNQTITYDVCDQVPSGTGNGACGNLGLGPIKATRITVPFYASWPSADCVIGAALNQAGQCGWLNPDYQQVTQIASKANSTYEAATIKVTRYGGRGLSLHAHYTYAHAMDWNPGESPLDPDSLSQGAGFSEEYGTSNLDVRHSAAAMVVYDAPWKLRNFAGRLANGWMLSGVGQFRSGLPYTMRVSGSLPTEFDLAGNAIAGLGPGMNGSGGDNRVYGVGNDGQVYNIGRNTFRYPATWKADLRLGKSFDLGGMRQLELLAESFNLFNHQNVTELETTGYYIGSGSATRAPTLNFLTGLKTNTKTGLPISAFGQPLSINGTNFYRERQIQFGLRMKF